MKRIAAYFVATVQSHIEHLERERERNSARAWEAEQKRRRISLEGGPNVGVDEPSWRHLLGLPQ